MIFKKTKNFRDFTPIYTFQNKKKNFFKYNSIMNHIFNLWLIDYNIINYKLM